MHAHSARRAGQVTASYVSPPMRALHEKAVGAGVTIINECGLDPGIDHMSAMKVRARRGAFCWCPVWRVRRACGRRVTVACQMQSDD